MSVLRSKEKISSISVIFVVAGVVGSERKNSLPRRLPNFLFPHYRSKRNFEKSPTAGSWRPLKCIFSGKEKRPPTAGRKPCAVRSMYGKTRRGQSATVAEQVSTTVPKSAILRFCPSRETCWGVPSPNPAMAACAAKRFPFGRPFFCENCPGNT